MWDVTVRDAGGTVRPGRLFSYEWQFRVVVPGSGTPATTNAYVYTRTGYEYQVNFYDHAGLNWIMTADDMGVVDRTTGERIYASFQGWLANVPTYFNAIAAPASRRFPQSLNRLDPDVISGPGGLAGSGYASAPIAPSSQPLRNAAFTGSGGQAGGTNRGSGGTISFSSPAALEGLPYAVAIDTNRDGTFGNGNDFVDRANTLSSTGSNSIGWNGQDATGAILQCGDYPYQAQSTLSEVHFTQLDVEGSGGMRIERLSLPGDPDLGNPFAMSYNDVDPYKRIATTDALADRGHQRHQRPGLPRVRRPGELRRRRRPRRHLDQTSRGHDDRHAADPLCRRRDRQESDAEPGIP